MTETRRGFAYLTDYYTTNDFLNFSDFRPALESILVEGQTPLTVGVFGPAGSGKTSMLQMLRHKMEAEELPYQRTVWFTAWKYERQESLWRAFILRVLDALYPRLNGDRPYEMRPRIPHEKLDPEQQQQAALLDHLQESVYRPVDWQELGRLTVDCLSLLQKNNERAVEAASAFLPVTGVVKSALKPVIGKKEDESDQPGIAGGIRHEIYNYHRQQLSYLEQFEVGFREALEQILGPHRRLIIFVDDLDRCLPEKAVEVLEAIKLFLEAPGTVFVLGMDRAVIEAGVEARYETLLRAARAEKRDLPISGDTYLQKIVQIPFYLPPLAVKDIEHYLEKLEEDVSPNKRLTEMTRAVFARGLYPNPRQVKRTLNIFHLLKVIAEGRENRGALPAGNIAWPLLAKTVVIQTQHPQLYQSWRRYPTLVQTLEAEYISRAGSEEETGQDRLALIPEMEEADTAPTGGLLDPYLHHRQQYALLEQMLRFPGLKETGTGREQAHFAGLSREEMRAYLHLAESVVADRGAVVDLPESPRDLLRKMLTSDRAKTLDAVKQLTAQEPDSKGPLHESVRQALVEVIGAPDQPVSKRVSAGYALGILGDPRSGVGMKDGLPDIDWIEIAVGPFSMGSDKGRDKYANYSELPQFACHLIRTPYRISCYPITVTQYRTFIDAGGYEQERYWTKAGWEWRTKDNITEPRTVPDVFLTPNHPQVGVSWYEAVAFCNWLSEKLGCRLSLPSEVQWERAARHTDGRIYPWDNEGEEVVQYCNMKETGIGNTSVVGIFPMGNAACGAADMAGNVWEWCSTKWLDNYEDYEQKVDNILEGTEKRVLRGGSFLDGNDRLRCAVRDGNSPDNRNRHLGFRVVTFPSTSALRLAAQHSQAAKYYRSAVSSQ